MTSSGTRRHTAPAPRPSLVTRALTGAALVLAIAMASPAAWAAAPPTPVPQDQPVSGVVLDARGAPIVGARVSAGPGAAEAWTDAQGRYSLFLPPGDHVLRVSHPSYEPFVRSVRVAAGHAPIEVRLDPRPYHLEENVVVRAVRAEPIAPVTASGIGRREIDQRNFGQEVPFLFKDHPSVTQYADAGSAAGYSYLSLRGIQQTRLNMTLDGVPLNEPEDSAVYFSNYADLAASIDSVQIQRGVGTSSVGAASYGGSVNFASVDPKADPEIAAEAIGGSFGTRRAALTLHSGVVGPGLAFYARAAYRDTDGYRENSGVQQRGLFFGSSRRDDRSFLKVFGFVGRSEHQLAFYAVEKDVLQQDRRFNPQVPSERDRFTQGLAHAQYTRYLSGNTSVAGQAYYQRAGGWYRIFGGGEANPLYQYGLNWQYGGGMVNVQHVRGNARFTAGAHAYTYASRHTRDITDAGREYRNEGHKANADAFTKVTWTAGPATLYGDLQVRHVRFRYDGDLDIGSVSWTFANPKAGLRVGLTPSLDAYASVGRMKREPTRADLFAGEDNPSVAYDLRAVAPERVTDVEAGLTLRRRNLSASANLYFMEFRNEIALTGELSEIGLPLRRNVPRSHRRGIEVELDWRPLNRVRLATTATVSQDRIAEWTQFRDVYAEDGAWIDSVPRTVRDVRPLLTPPAIVNQRIEVSPASGLQLAAAGRWVARSWLDNTNTGELRTPAWFGLDLSGSLSLARWIRNGQPRLRVHVENVLDNRDIYPSGYSYLYLLRDAAGGSTTVGVPYFYPQATRSVFVGIEVRM
ncbi:MAG TPA: TonB-dependent receptor [Vicinamibacterales bacterium]|nr:TonB-dependent receptor [Vicinamibacterales bacterium]